MKYPDRKLAVAPRLNAAARSFPTIRLGGRVMPPGIYVVGYRAAQTFEAHVQNLSRCNAEEQRIYEALKDGPFSACEGEQRLVPTSGFAAQSRHLGGVSIVLEQSSTRVAAFVSPARFQVSQSAESAAWFARAMRTGCTRAQLVTVIALNLGPVGQMAGTHILRQLIAHPGVGRLAWESGGNGGALRWEQTDGADPLWKGFPKALAPPAVIQAAQAEPAPAEHSANQAQRQPKIKMVGDERQMLAEPSVMATLAAAVRNQKTAKRKKK